MLVFENIYNKMLKLSVQVCPGSIVLVDERQTPVAGIQSGQRGRVGWHQVQYRKPNHSMWIAKTTREVLNISTGKSVADKHARLAVNQIGERGLRRAEKYQQAETNENCFIILTHKHIDTIPE